MRKVLQFCRHLICGHDSAAVYPFRCGSLYFTTFLIDYGYTSHIATGRGQGSALWAAPVCKPQATRVLDCPRLWNVFGEVLSKRRSTNKGRVATLDHARMNMKHIPNDKLPQESDLRLDVQQCV
jgi:hypothetical protein